LKTIVVFLTGLPVGAIFGYVIAVYTTGEPFLLEWSTVLMVVSTVIMAIFTAGVWHIEFSNFRRIYNPKLRVHIYPAEQSVYTMAGISHTPCLRFRMALVNPGGVPISLMNDEISLVEANSGKKVKAQSKFVFPEMRPERLYVSQFPWVIKDFCIYEKVVFPEESDVRKTFTEKNWRVHIKLKYEVKSGKIEQIEKVIPWQARKEKTN